MRTEKSCGAVVFREKDYKKQILLIRHVNGGHWAFPKGHVEKGETEEQTALREILEETGLDVILDNRYRQVVSYSPRKDVIKDVVFTGGCNDYQKIWRNRSWVSHYQRACPNDGGKYSRRRRTRKGI